MKYSHHFLVRVQYLGFRYSGWQQQPNFKTVEGMLVKTLKFILESPFKIVGAGRTDAKVSSLEGAFELFTTDVDLEPLTDFKALFNKNTPPDIRIISIEKVSETFNIIKDAREKTYGYLFSYGEKNHPFAAPTMANFTEDLDIKAMQKGAALFEGTHDFKNFTVRNKSESKNTLRTVKYCKLEENIEYTASFYPDTSYLLEVKGKGFLRYQIRLIMGALYLVGKGELTPEYLEMSLSGHPDYPVSFVAPGSGLFLKELRFNIP